MTSEFNGYKKQHTGNSASVAVTLGVKNKAMITNPNRGYDYYATNPKALELLLTKESFSNVWECADGEGHLCRVLKKYNILEKHSDIIDRGCGEVIDFLKYSGTWHGDIITNPPYRWATEFVLKALDIIPEGRKVAMFLRIQFLESKSRYKKIFKQYPPKNIYVFDGRIRCGLNGNFSKSQTAIMFAWFV